MEKQSALLDYSLIPIGMLRWRNHTIPFTHGIQAASTLKSEHFDAEIFFRKPFVVGRLIAWVHRSAISLGERIFCL
ncbi:MAG TPA: hypothetical protein PLZ55_12090, partial [bacterium]|nr:hypothetical protein [bacterium]